MINFEEVVRLKEDYIYDNVTNLRECVLKNSDKVYNVKEKINLSDIVDIQSSLVSVFESSGLHAPISPYIEKAMLSVGKMKLCTDIEMPALHAMLTEEILALYEVGYREGIFNAIKANCQDVKLVEKQLAATMVELKELYRSPLMAVAQVPGYIDSIANFLKIAADSVEILKNQEGKDVMDAVVETIQNQVEMDFPEFE